MTNLKARIKEERVKLDKFEDILEELPDAQIVEHEDFYPMERIFSWSISKKVNDVGIYKIYDNKQGWIIKVDCFIKIAGHEVCAYPSPTIIGRVDMKNNQKIIPKDNLEKSLREEYELSEVVVEKILDYFKR